MISESQPKKKKDLKDFFKKKKKSSSPQEKKKKRNGGGRRKKGKKKKRNHTKPPTYEHPPPLQPDLQNLSSPHTRREEPIVFLRTTDNLFAPFFFLNFTSIALKLHR